MTPRPPVRIIVVPVGGQPRVELTTGSLAAMQKLVGGTLQVVSLGDLDLWCNDDGLGLRLPFNRAFGPHRIFGQFFLTRRRNAHSKSVTARDIADWGAVELEQGVAP